MNILANGVLTDPAMVALIIGFVSPHLIAILQQQRFKNWQRVGIAVLWSAVAGVGTAFFTGEFTGLSVVSSFLLVLVSTITFYKNFWKPTGITGAIEHATTPKKHRQNQLPTGDYPEGPPAAAPVVNPNPEPAPEPVVTEPDPVEPPQPVAPPPDAPPVTPGDPTKVG